MKFRAKIILGIAGLLTVGLGWFVIYKAHLQDGVNADTIRRDSVVQTNTTLIADSSQTKNISVDNDSLVLKLTKQILTIIKANDYKKLANYIHPSFGVRFSPYAYISTDNIKLTADQFLLQSKTHDKLDWGNYDGSGDTILLSVDEYFKEFVYDADFLNAEKTSLNKMLGSGNSLNNLGTVYKGCDYTESYFSGFDKKFDGMDWCCLRLVYKKYQDKIYLVAIIHDQWTI